VERRARQVVEGLLAAAFEGADQVRSFEPALQRAAKASYAVYGEESPAYWAKYYTGVKDRDKTGIPIFLGGSTVSNLGDNELLFGLTEGSGNLFKLTYEGFGRVVQKQYPRLCRRSRQRRTGGQHAVPAGAQSHARRSHSRRLPLDFSDSTACHQRRHGEAQLVD
jgi:hypothetical protein